MENDLEIWEMAIIFGKWLKNLTNGLNMWELTYICAKRLKYLNNE